MQNFARNLLTEWRRLGLPFAEETFVVAVSGGADSVSLMLGLYELRKLKKLNLRFVAAHFNHNLRGEESEKDEQFVKNLAGEFGFELALGNGDIPRDGNLEQSARNARYGFLTERAESLHAYAVLTAHTRNDQAETLLINLLRGSGLEGLGGMKPVRILKTGAPVPEFVEESEIKNQKSKIFLIRPLLNWAKRIDTENFCHLNDVEYRYDTMNEDLTFRRVRIRKVLLPLLEDFNPKIIDALAQTAWLLREDFEALQSSPAGEEIKQNDAEPENAGNQAALSLNEIRDIFPSMRRRILRDWLKNCRGDLRRLEAKHFEAIENLIFSRKSGKIIELPKGETIVKEKGKLHFKKLS